MYAHAVAVFQTTGRVMAPWWRTCWTYKRPATTSARSTSLPLRLMQAKHPRKPTGLMSSCRGDFCPHRCAAENGLALLDRKRH